MNTNMYHNPIVQDNIMKLELYGMEIIPADNGYLACGDIGEGKMPSEQVLLDYILKDLAFDKDMQGLNVLVTAGPTIEKIDPVRFISNLSTGKMGYAIARRCMQRGASVTLITGKTNSTPPPFVKVIEIESAKDMFEAVKDIYETQDIIIKSAAVADYTPKIVSTEKVKKKDTDISITLERTQDILAYLGEHRKANQFICGFSMETENMLEHSMAKLEKKHIDMIVANNLKQTGAGFGTDTNIVTFLTKKEKLELPIMSKDEVAGKLVDFILQQRK
jgi:phosphopantothenoylcysteine decarboxylase/phosphopantothenate--cysteine ligase